MRRALVIGMFLFAASRGAAQASLGAGITVGSARLADARTERVVSGVIQLQPRPWLSLSAMPAMLHVSDSVGGSTSGVGDLPLVAAATANLPTRWSPTLGGALIVALPTGSVACGLGNGTTTAGVDIGVGVAPTAGLRFSAGAIRSLSGLAGQSSLSPPRATTLQLEGAADVASGWTVGLSVGADVGTADSTQALSRTAGAGLTHILHGALAVTVDASHGLTAASPRWVVSVGLGTVFSGISPVSPTSPLRRLKSSFGSAAGRSRGSNKIGACG